MAPVEPSISSRPEYLCQLAIPPVLSSSIEHKWRVQVYASYLHRTHETSILHFLLTRLQQYKHTTVTQTCTEEIRYRHWYT